ncbi:MAG: MFS transporter [Bacillota bacterium]|nr:MFS transporter [Bacillota bacterium]
MKHENVSRYRWVILITTMPIIVATEMMWLSFSPIASVIAEHYNVSTAAVDLLATSYMLMFIVFAIPSSFVIDKFGFRRSLLIGATLTGVFGLTRAIFAGSFTLVIISQFLIAIGQPFLLNITTKAAANWFPFEERATADGLLTMAQYLGFTIPMVLSPILVDAVGVQSMLFVFAVIGVIAALLVIIFVREKPAVPPPGPKYENVDFSMKTYGNLFRNKAYVLALAITFISLGAFNAILTLIESILLPRGITPDEAGLIGAAFVVAGVIGAVVLPIVSDHIKVRKKIILIAMCLLVPLYLGLALMASFIPLMIIAAIAGFSIMGAGPILFQHASEVAYPAQEGTSLGLIYMMGQISGALFVLIFEMVNASTGSPVAPMIGLVILTAIEIPMVLAMKESKLVQQAKAEK